MKLTLTRRLVVIVGAACALLAAFAIPALAREPAGAAAEPQGNLYAVEIKTGPAWDKARPAHEQQHFREHSANLVKLRDQGALVLGARYSDKGLIVLRAGSEQEARSMVEQDVSIRNGVFAYELHDFNVFYGGSVQPRRRRP